MSRCLYKGLILYPNEDFTHKKAIQLIRENYCYALINHNLDVTDTGELKKEHIHVVIKLDNTMSNDSLAKKLMIKSNYIQDILSLKGALTYLIHLNNSKKYQYSVNDVEGELKSNLLDYLNKTYNDNASQFNSCLQLIKAEKPKTIMELIELCSNNGFYDVLHRDSYILINLVKSMR